MKFTEYITEHYHNLFNPAEKYPFAQQTWDLLQRAYALIGGLKGGGLHDVKDMISNIPMWKVVTRNGQVKVVILYKDRNGRKLVAMGTDGSVESKTVLLNILKHEFARSYAELSGLALNFVSKRLPELVSQYAIPAEQVAKIAAASGKQITPVDRYQYVRDINGIALQKMMIGTIGHKIESPKP